MAACSAGGLGVFLLSGESSGVASAVSAYIAVMANAVVGAVVIGRQPRNALAWIFCASPFFAGLSCAAQVLVDHGPQGSLHTVAAFVADSGWILAVGLPACFIGLLIPDGRLPSRRWRPVAWVAGVALTCAVFGQDLSESTLAGSVANPIRVAGAEWVFQGAAIVLLGLLLASVLAMVLRYRRGNDIERLQLRWIIAAFVVTMGCGVAANNLPLPEGVWFVSWALLPAAFAIAIFRYRLYEIDVIIRRTIVYAVVVGVLAVLYLVGVALIGRALEAVTGQSSVAAVTISTLAVAAAFQPLRARIQVAVDRRFYRRKYDAVRTLEHFAGALRDETALETLEQEVLRAAVTSVQPRHASLWLRER
jgi:hypothetical protein